MRTLSCYHNDEIIRSLLSTVSCNAETALTCFSSICSTPLCDCTADTELVRGINSPIQQVNIAILSIEVDCVSIIFLLEYSTAQRAYPMEYQMS